MHKSPEGPTREGTETEHHVALMGTDSELCRTGLNSSSSTSWLMVLDKVLDLSVSQFPLCKMKTTSGSHATEPHVRVCRRQSLHTVRYSEPARLAVSDHRSTRSHPYYPTQQHRQCRPGRRIIRYYALGPRFLKRRSNNTFENELNQKHSIF